MSAPERGVRRALGYADLARLGFKLGRAGEDQVRHNAREHLARRLGRLRGLPHKLGQMLSLSADEETAAAFRPLTASVDPLPLDAIVGTLAQAWGRQPSELLESIEEPGIAASLGQVHRATLRDGREVAVKVRYPGVREAVEQDLGALGWLSLPLGGLDRRGFDLSGYQAEIRRDLAEELDYEREARSQERFAALCQGEPWIVPRVVSELSNEAVLVTTWEPGEPLEEVRRWSPQDRGELGFELARLFARTVLGEGLLHADPHEGNYAFRLERGQPRVVLYDFGSVFELSERERLLLIRLIRAAAGEAEDDPLRLLVALGFREDLLEPLAERLPALLSLLLLPYRQQGQFDLTGWDLGPRVADVLGEDRWNFRISAPPRLLFLMRAWQGLIHQLRALERPVSWRLPAEPFLRRDAAAAAALELPDLAQRSSFALLAKHLRVEVREDGRQKVKLSLPASTVDHVEDLVDPEVLDRIRESGVDLEERKRSIRRQAYRPQEVFALETGGRSLRVWLE